jgi:hypothetical protein
MESGCGGVAVGVGGAVPVGMGVVDGEGVGVGVMVGSGVGFGSSVNRAVVETSIVTAGCASTVGDTWLAVLHAVKLVHNIPKIIIKINRRVCCECRCCIF